MTTTTTPSTSTQTSAAVMNAAVERFANWRATREHGQRIPDALWQEATTLARIHGISAIAAKLKLSYYDLQRRVLGRIERKRRGSRPAAFVELAPPTFDSGSFSPGTIELLLASGVRLIVRLPAATPRDLLPLVQLLLRQS